MKSSNKNIIVIIGVTSGLGRDLAYTFSRKNWQVIGLGRRSEEILHISKELGENFFGIEADITKQDEVENAFSKIDRDFLKIDLIINNASVFIMKEFIRCKFTEINTIIDTNLKGIMYVTLEALKIMTKNNNPGRIVNIASVAATHGIENQAIYCASKYGINGFSEALNQELIKSHNISITTIFPGGMDTPLWNDENPYPGKDKLKILKTTDIIGAIEYISTLNPRVILKNMTIFPSNEWH